MKTESIRDYSEGEGGQKEDESKSERQGRRPGAGGKGSGVHDCFMGYCRPDPIDNLSRQLRAKIVTLQEVSLQAVLSEPFSKG